MLPIVIASVFLAVTAILLVIAHAVYKIRSEENVIKKRLDALIKPDLKDLSEAPFILRDDQLSRIPLFNRILEKLDVTKTLETMLRQTDLKMRVGELALLMFICAGVGMILTVGSSSAPPKIVVPIAMFFIPLLYVQFHRTRRLRAFIREFPDAIDMMTSALRAGHAFPRAMQLVAEESPDPVGVEFRKTFEEYNLGMELRETLVSLTERVDSSDLRLFVTAVLLQKETGGNLTEILEKIGYTIRERFKLMGQLRTYTAQGRMSALVLGLLPIAFMLIISIMSPGYLEPLFTTKTGHLMLFVAVFMQIVGFIIIRKIVRIKYQ
ncbi:type II secretion system F family protein [candidate division KSB1 bacterium]|nr:type II secretion system F family protein [candidate division KSB1 bacterium]